mmetsp:Transcript_52352/g.71464  ORF Transcript_52352/g.71464 Transcript_52352/m.71464 type:complete len:459 (+) Transcript_52352:805-2181(+)
MESWSVAREPALKQLLPRVPTHHCSRRELIGVQCRVCRRIVFDSTGNIFLTQPGRFNTTPVEEVPRRPVFFLYLSLCFQESCVVLLKSDQSGNVDHSIYTLAGCMYTDGGAQGVLGLTAVYRRPCVHACFLYCSFRVWASVWVGLEPQTRKRELVVSRVRCCRVRLLAAHQRCLVFAEGVEAAPETHLAFLQGRSVAISPGRRLHPLLRAPLVDPFSVEEESGGRISSGMYATVGVVLCKELRKAVSQFRHLRVPAKIPAADAVYGAATVSFRKTDATLRTRDDVNDFSLGGLVLITGHSRVKLRDMAPETMPFLAARSPALWKLPKVDHMESRPTLRVSNRVEHSGYHGARSIFAPTGNFHTSVVTKAGKLRKERGLRYSARDILPPQSAESVVVAEPAKEAEFRFEEFRWSCCQVKLFTNMAAAALEGQERGCSPLNRCSVLRSGDFRPCFIGQDP